MQERRTTPPLPRLFALLRGFAPPPLGGSRRELWLASVDEAIAHAAQGEMTVDAALVTLDFALRHRLLEASEHEALARRAASLWR